jgi:hypothetical protein
LHITSEEDTEAESDSEPAPCPFKRIGLPIFTGEPKNDIKVFYNEEHKKHIKIEPLKIPSGDYSGIKISEEIKKTLLNIVTDIEAIYVICKKQFQWRKH